MMKTLMMFFALILLTISTSNKAYCQEYLDYNKRYMKLKEVSTDNTYGFEIKNPIKVGSDKKAIGAYLNSLKLLDGDRLHIGAMKFDYQNQIGLTMVVLTFEQKKETSTVYFLSSQFEQPKAIIGYSFKTIDDIPKVNVFPSESIVKVASCSQTLYLVDDFLIKEKFGNNPKPSINPSFTGGLDELKKYFSTNSLTNENAKQIVFKVSIGFLVSCNGKAGNYIIVTKGRDDLETYSNQILAIVNKMPQKWLPATVDGKPVDCYQVLSFMVIDGKLDKVSYK